MSTRSLAKPRVIRLVGLRFGVVLCCVVLCCSLCRAVFSLFFCAAVFCVFFAVLCSLLSVERLWRGVSYQLVPEVSIH